MNFNKFNILFKIILTIIILFTNILIYFVGENLKISIILGIFSIIILLMICLYEKMCEKYMNDNFIKLSNMLSSIINENYNEEFSIMDDTLFSKLQHQTLKLTNILTEKNKQMEKDKDEVKTLISDIAHQLKTPLTNLKMYEEFLSDESLSEEDKKEFREIIFISLNRLMFLVESMIKMSRLESGVISLNKNHNNLNETLLMSISQIQKKAKIKNIKITLEEINNINIHHDINWMSEAIFNILENAVKYSNNNDFIQIKIQSYEMFSRIDVKDSGIGIDEEEIPKIFKRFYRGKKTQSIEGIGIGLYLSREIISKHSGYIKVKSDKSETVFSIFLPNN